MATTYGVSSGDHIRPLRYARLKEFPIDVSQTVLRGSVLKVSGNAGYENRLVLNTDSTTTGIVGVATEAITTTATHNAATDKILVWLAEEGVEFIGRTPSDDAVDFSDIGVRVELEIDGTNSITRVHTNAVTNETVEVLDYLNPNTMQRLTSEGDLNAWCVFKFLPGATIYGVSTVLA